MDDDARIVKLGETWIPLKTWHQEVGAIIERLFAVDFVPETKTVEASAIAFQLMDLGTHRAWMPDQAGFPPVEAPDEPSVSQRRSCEKT